MLMLELFTYQQCFKHCKKLRPAFRLHNTIYALTNSRPRTKHLVLRKEAVKSQHFQAKKNFVYLVKANPLAIRYNNIAGGCLILTRLQSNLLGFTKEDQQIFSLQLQSHIIMLEIEFKNLLPVTNEDWGLSEAASAEEIYNLAGKSAKGEALTEDEVAVTSSEKWPGIIRQILRTQIRTVQNELPFEAATVAAFTEAEDSDLEEVIGLVVDLLESGTSPVEQGSVAQKALETLEVVFGPANLSKYETPATSSEIAKAIETPAASESVNSPDTPAIPNPTTAVAVVSSTGAKEAVTGMLEMGKSVREMRKRIAEMEDDYVQRLETVAISLANDLENPALPATAAPSEELAIEA